MRARVARLRGRPFAVSLIVVMGVSLALAAGAVAGCGSGLPVPPGGPHADDEPIVVPYPPPPARPELIPKNTLGKTAVWVDGEWEWKGSRWVWQSGQWEAPYPGSYYARPTTVWLSDKRIAWFRGSWHAKEDALRPAASAEPAAPAGGGMVPTPLPTAPPAPGSESISPTALAEQDGGSPPPGFALATDAGSEPAPDGGR